MFVCSILIADNITHYSIFLVMFTCGLIIVFLQIWAMAVGKNTEMLATGGGDPLVNLWHDCTATDEEADFLKEVCWVIISLKFNIASMRFVSIRIVAVDFDDGEFVLLVWFLRVQSFLKKDIDSCYFVVALV